MFYAGNSTKIKVVNNKQFSDAKCLDCPYGAECPGSVLKAKPNYWGYKYEGEFLFQ